MIDKTIVIVCTGRRGWHADDVVELATLAPVGTRADLALVAGLAGVNAPDETADARRGYGVIGTKTTMESGRSYVDGKAEARIIDGPAGAVLQLPVCPRCWHPVGHVAKDAQRRREDRPNGKRVPVAKVDALAAMFVPVDGRVEVNVAMLPG